MASLLPQVLNVRAAPDGPSTPTPTRSPGFVRGAGTDSRGFRGPAYSSFPNKDTAIKYHGGPVLTVNPANIYLVRATAASATMPQ
jgi:hypothetical protein